MDCQLNTMGADLQYGPCNAVKDTVTIMTVDSEPSLTDKVKKFVLNYGPFFIAGAAIGAVVYAKGYGMCSLPAFLNGTSTGTNSTATQTDAQSSVCEVAPATLFV